MGKTRIAVFIICFAFLSIQCGTQAADGIGTDIGGTDTGGTDTGGTDGSGPIRRTESTFSGLGLRVSTLVSGLDTPWDLVWGPDGWIWFTERPGRVSRVNPATGEVRVLAVIDAYERGESGLMGMAFHPDFDRNPWVYFSRSYDDGGSIRNRVIRMRYSGSALTGTETLLDGIPGAGNHDGSRLAFGPDGFLYVTTGDAGRSSLAQNTGSLAGKVLRLTDTGKPAPGNPFGNEVYSYGHRNPQGLAFNPSNGRFYLTEHGPSDNDEINIVEEGGNFGWPRVHGFHDGDTAGELEFLGSADAVEPIAAWTPTTAPAGAEFYEKALIPGWNGSLLFTTLKGSALVRLTLSDGGNRVTGEETISEGEFGRLRDVLVAPDGTVYLATSNRDGRGNPSSDDDRILVVRPR